MDAQRIQLAFEAEEEGIDGVYAASDVSFVVVLDSASADRLQVEGATIPLKRNWQSSGVKDGEALTEFSLSGEDRTGLINVSIELLEVGYARASLHWPQSHSTREIIGFCEDWKTPKS